MGVLLGMAGICAAVSLVAYTYNKLTESPAVKPQQQQQQDVGGKSGGAAAAGSKKQAGAKPPGSTSESGAVVIELPGTCGGLWCGVVVLAALTGYGCVFLACMLPAAGRL